MEVRFILNQKQVAVDAAPDAVLMNVLRDLGCKSVKCGCETTNCGLCTVWIDGKSRLSCSVLAAGVEGHEVTTLEGVEQEAEEFGRFLAKEGAEQCGFCSPGFIMNVLAMMREYEEKAEKSGEGRRAPVFCAGFAIYLRPGGGSFARPGASCCWAPFLLPPCLEEQSFVCL